MQSRRKKSPQALFDDHAQQPSDVVARRAQHRVDPIADLAQRPSQSPVLFCALR
jgi:hypothetical protein